MKQATKKKSLLAATDLSQQFSRRLREALMIVAAAVAVFLSMSLLSYSSVDPGWSQFSQKTSVHNFGGRTGAWFADVFYYLFGFLSFIFPVLVLYSGCLLYQGYFLQHRYFSWLLAGRIFGVFVLILAGCGLLAMPIWPVASALPVSLGGVLGELISRLLIVQFNVFGGTLILVALLLMAITFVTGLSWLAVSHKMAHKTIATVLTLLSVGKDWSTHCYSRLHKRQSTRPSRTLPLSTPARVFTHANGEEPRQPTGKIKSEIKLSAATKTIKKSKRAEKERQLKLFSEPVTGELPALSLLESPKQDPQQQLSSDNLQAMSQLVEMKLADFSVAAQVVAVHPGPVITRFEIKLAAGVKVSKITGLSKDLARSLAVVSVRIVEVIPGKPVIGLELPNEHRQVVCLQEVLASEEYDRQASPLALALGKDIAGLPVVVDLAKMPHLLVAGTTGSGKSVGLNGMLLSLLFKSQPEEVRLILIDPKMLELAVYDDIPHLLAPVVTDMKEASNALKWCVAEMERRYQLMAALGVRNLSGYNRKIREAIKNNSPLSDPTYERKPGDDSEAPLLEAMPYIVVVVDEFADMMMVVGKKVEELIARIAQKARAAGIHLILATQRPSVDVITGLIKANVPTRIAFQVASRIDSRTILDQMGAEQLLGRGDMLYLPIGAGIPTRVHGAFVDDAEVHRVVEDWKKRAQPDYLEEILQGSHGQAAGLDKGLLMNDEESDEDIDPFYDEAVKVVTESRRASISLVQRKLKIGYNRAARLVEQMEEQGVVSAMQSNGSREVLAPPPVALG